MIADPVSLKRVHIACAVMLSFAACGMAPLRKSGVGPNSVTDSFGAKDGGQTSRVEGVRNADSFGHSTGGAA